MIGLELSIDGRPIVGACRDQQVLINCTQGRILRLLSAMTITRSEVDRGLAVLEGVLTAHVPQGAGV